VCNGWKGKKQIERPRCRTLDWMKKRLDISKFEIETTLCIVWRYVKKLMPKNCPWAENLNKKNGWAEKVSK